MRLVNGGDKAARWFTQGIQTPSIRVFGEFTVVALSYSVPRLHRNAPPLCCDCVITIFFLRSCVNAEVGG